MPPSPTDLTARREHDDLPARREREALCDLLLAVGPDHPTLCGDWTTAELAAHLHLREQRPDVMAGILASQFDGWVARRLQRHHGTVVAAATDLPYDETVEAVRRGPPDWSPLVRPSVDRAVNTAEFFVHHEDVRRARADWEPREPDPALDDDLDRIISSRARRLAVHAPCGLVLWPDERAPILAKRALPIVELFGPVEELTLFLHGRLDHAHVDVQVPEDAPPSTADRLRATSFAV